MTVQVKNNPITPTNPTLLKADFLKYVRTMEILNYKKGSVGVHISQKDLERDFFVYPKYNRKEILKELVDECRLEIITGKYKKYHCLEEGEIDIDLLKPIQNYDLNNKVLKDMKKHLKNVGGDFFYDTTIYFDTFLKMKETHLEHFFKVDNFARRIHTPLTSLPKRFRDYISLYGVETESIDVVQMQPLLLGRLLEEDYGLKNELSDYINKGGDVYKMLQEKGNLGSRKEAKTKFFEILFGKPSKDLENVFGNANWIEWINEFKTKQYKNNPRTDIKRHSNLAYVLQSMEVSVMYKIWQNLYEQSIPFVTVHDEVIVQKYDLKETEKIFNKVLSFEFNMHQLNVSNIEDVDFSFDLNDLQIERLIEEVINTLCLERGVKFNNEGKKLKKDELENVMSILKPYLTNEATFIMEIKRMYFEKYKSFITDASLKKCIDFYRENRMLINNKFGRFFFK